MRDGGADARVVRYHVILQLFELTLQWLTATNRSRSNVSRYGIECAPPLVLVDFGCVIILGSGGPGRRGGLIGSRVHQPDKSAGGVAAAMPFSSAERATIREQLERVLASPLFRNSKRYTSLLRFSVEKRLEGTFDCLKERSMGIEVFGREPDYNTTNDPVVRTSAVEVRKRLAEYYQQPGHEHEMRIELPAGCYVPEFRMPETVAAMETVAPIVEPAREAVAPAPLRANESRANQMPARARIVIAVAGICTLIALVWWKPWQPAEALDQFWHPLWESSAPVLFSVTGLPGPPLASGQPVPASASAGVSDLLRSGRDAVPLPDVTALVNVASLLKSKGKAYRIRMARDIQFQDLRAGPVVLIGPVPRGQQWLGAGWRFNIARNQEVTETWISDRDHPQARDWLVHINAATDATADEYALVTRVSNDTIGQTVVVIAGLTTYATTAAGELLCDARQMQRLAQMAPKGWERKNIQLVISAKRVGTSAGKPRIAAINAW